MVGLKSFEMVVKLVEEVFVLCWHLWVVSLDDITLPSRPRHPRIFLPPLE